MSSPRALAVRLRHVLLAGAIVCWLAAAFALVLGSRDDWIYVLAPIPPVFFAGVGWLQEAGLGDGFVIWGALVLGWLLITQWMFLRPRRGWRVELAQTGRPLKSAIVAAAFVAALVTGGLLYTLLELARPLSKSPWLEGWIEVPVLVLWGAWAWIFFRARSHGDRQSQLDRMTKRLLAGSLLELLVAIPADVVAARKESCYCGRGSYWGIVMGGIALVWSFGPGIVFLYLRAKADRERRERAGRAAA